MGSSQSCYTSVDKTGFPSFCQPFLEISCPETRWCLPIALHPHFEKRAVFFSSALPCRRVPPRFVPPFLLYTNASCHKCKTSSPPCYSPSDTKEECFAIPPFVTRTSLPANQPFSEPGSLPVIFSTWHLTPRSMSQSKVLILRHNHPCFNQVMKNAWG